jgi:TonB family protein
MQAELLSLLLRCSLAMTVALAIVLLLGPLLRRWLGAVAAYRAWLIVPVVSIASVLPVWSPLQQTALPGVTLEAVRTIAQSVEAQAPSVFVQTLLLFVWVAGAVLVSLMLMRQQFRFVHSLGALEPCGDGVWRATSAHGAPALVGAIAPRIVLPAAFEQRYSPVQQQLILLHERTHLRCHDAEINALAALMRCLFWFNPLLHFAGVRLRIDQELACDARVLRQRPDARRPYAEAMLNTQLADTGLPVGCQWQSSHPLKERIHMMTHPLPGRLRRSIGNVLLAALIGSVGTLAWAMQMPTPSGAAASAATQASGDRDPAFASLQRPKYPAQAMRDRVSGRVLMQIAIDERGIPLTIDVIESQPPGVFDAAASAAAEHWTFQPALKHGVPVAATFIVPVDFALDGEEPAPAPVAKPEPQVLDTLKVRERGH